MEQGPSNLVDPRRLTLAHRRRRGGAVTSSQPVRTPLAALVCELLIEAIWTIFDLRRVGHNAILEVGLRGSGLITALVLLRMVVQVTFDPGE